VKTASRSVSREAVVIPVDVMRAVKRVDPRIQK
jgi:hypothetical protein